MSETQKVEQSDVEEITHRIEVITERADQVKTKAFSLRSLAKPAGECAEASPRGDFASDIKHRLDRIQDILDEAADSLGRFAG